MQEEIINKVSQSALVTLDLESFYPTEEIKIFDLKPFLFMELILKEKDFRAALESTDWSVYKDKIVGVYCSADAVIPVWAYMLVTSYLQPYAMEVVMGDETLGNCRNAIKSTADRGNYSPNGADSSGAGSSHRAPQADLFPLNLLSRAPPPQPHPCSDRN